ncbi:MAG: class I SAM-dependent methyltransferase [Desulfobacteraceae bacterium]|jgi:2-polyprenyl-3-methyl-5-hydroxy-6-metoxy-1,4-benzoquinol methylase|nr:class I SAM-dependent methyltransferase [Desulfobacteraceae bacterium]
MSFSEKMIDILNYGAINLAMAIGYRTGLFDVMDTFDSPQNIGDISDQAGLNPRYVQEWLGIMTTAEIVELSQKEDENQYFLPKHCGDLITRRAGNSNLGVYTQEIPLLTTCAMEAVIEGFSSGEGVTYDHYPKFQAFMSQLANAKHRQVLINKFLPSVENSRIVQRLKAGIQVCDLGCAEGVAVILMAESFPQSRFVGIDISSEAIDEARRQTRRQKLENLDFMVLDAADLKNNREMKGLFDYVTAFDAIHDQTRPLDVLLGVNHILRLDGRFSMVDIAAKSDLADNLDHPMGPFLYTVSLMHCLPVGLVGGGTGLGMMWGREKAVEMLKEARFQQVQVIEMPDDPFNLHFFCAK